MAGFNLNGLSLGSNGATPGGMISYGQGVPAGGGDLASLLALLQKSQQTAPQSLAQMLPYLPYLNNMDSYTQNSRDLAGAIGDTNSPQYQNLYGQFKQQGQDNLSAQIAEMDRQNRKQSALGRTPLFSPERGGETTFRGLTQGYQDVQNNASKQAFGQLDNAYKAAAQQDQLKQQNALQKANVFGSGAGAIAKLFGL